MIISDSLVCLHLHKFGGTFLNALLMTCLRSARRVGYHLLYSEVPTAFRRLPVLGTVRNLTGLARDDDRIDRLAAISRTSSSITA